MRSSNLILLVEPEQQEVSLFEKAIRRQGITNPFRVLPHIDEVKKYLRGAGLYENRELFPLPALLFLNLDGRKENVRNFLFWLRNASPVKELVVVGLSHFEHRTEVQQLLDMGLNGFFIKGRDTFETLQLVQDLELLEDILSRERAHRPGRGNGC